MEMKNENSALLSNLEVLMLLRDIQAGRNGQQKPTKHQQNLGTIAYETTRYLEDTPCALQTPAHLASFSRAVEGFRLTKAEKLQLVNSRPTTTVEVLLMVEESEERFTSEEEMDKLHEVVLTHLPGPEPEPASPTENAEDEGEEEEEGAEEGEEEEAMEGDYVAI